MDERTILDVLGQAIEGGAGGGREAKVVVGPYIGRVAIEMELSGTAATFSWPHPDPYGAVLLPSMKERLARRLLSLGGLPMEIEEVPRTENGPLSWVVGVGTVVDDGLMMIMQDRLPDANHLYLTPKGAGWDASMKSDGRDLTSDPSVRGVLRKLPGMTMFTCGHQNGRLHYAAQQATYTRSRNEKLDAVSMMRAASRIG